MQSILLALLVAAQAVTAASAPASDMGASSVDSPQPPSAIYETAKAIPALEQCLTDSLSKLGDVTSIQTEGTTTLMLKTGTESPMLIDLAPPKVIVTTKFAYGTRSLVKACL